MRNAPGYALGLEPQGGRWNGERLLFHGFPSDVGSEKSAGEESLFQVFRPALSSDLRLLRDSEAIGCLKFQVTENASNRNYFGRVPGKG
jgi:hypothetical protein